MLLEFETNLKKVHEEYKQSENFSTKLKNYYQKKLDKQEGSHEDEVTDLKMKQYEEHDTLHTDVQAKEEILRTNERKKKKEHSMKEKYQMDYDEEVRKRDMARTQIEKLKQDIQQKQRTKEEEIEKLYKRETDLYKYKFKIKDLKKSKHVLTHRAKEMQQSL